MSLSFFFYWPKTNIFSWRYVLTSFIGLTIEKDWKAISIIVSLIQFLSLISPRQHIKHKISLEHQHILSLIIVTQAGVVKWAKSNKNLESVIHTQTYLGLRWSFKTSYLRPNFTSKSWAHIFYYPSYSLIKPIIVVNKGLILDNPLSMLLIPRVRNIRWWLIIRWVMLCV